MPRASKGTSSKPGRKSRANAPAARQAARSNQPAGDRFLDDRSRRDIAGVICAVVAVALFIVSLMPGSGIVTQWLSSVLHIGLGLGTYILPFVLVLISVSLIWRSGENQSRMSARVTVGLIILFFALLVILAAYTPGLSGSNLQVLFNHENLVNQGGYVGALVAYLFLLLFGQLVTTIIMIGVIIVALIIIGFSLSDVVDKIRAHAAELRSPDGEADPDGVLPAPAYKPLDVSKPRRGSRDSDRRDPVMKRGGAGRGASAGVTQKIDFGATPAQPVPRAAAARDVAAETGASAALTRRLGKRARNDADAAPKRSAAPAGVTTPKPSEGFILPDMKLIKSSGAKVASKETEETLRETAMLLQNTLADFGVDAEVVGWAAGPTVTLFKVSLPSGVRVSKVTNLTDDIALAMASQGVRIFSPIPGTNYVGIEVPNVKRRSVLLGDVLPQAGKSPLEVAIGEDVEGHPIVSDLAKMPHLLIGGTTGSGKSVSINGMIMSILMRATPAEVRFIMIDPKRVEFTPYNGIPHLYVPVVTECKEAASALSWAVAEMERRLKVFSKVGARNIGQYNAKCQNGMQIGEEDAEQLPYIVIIIDELADLMMNVGKEVEFSISRLAQLARAAGIHMIVATQRPSTNVVTGLIKANITNRIAFNVASGIDSRVILDTPGAENLIGWGDMLLSKPEYSKPQRLQGCLVTEEEITAVVTHLKEQGEPEYHQEILQTNVISLGDTAPDGSGGSSTADDPLIWEAADIVVSSGLGSTSNIQRRLKVGYSRAGRIMDMLEDKGIVGPPNGSKPREVLVDAMELETLKAFEQNDANTGE